MKYVSLFFLIVTLCFACSDSQVQNSSRELDVDLLNVDYQTNMNMSTIRTDLDTSEINNAKIALGRVLFYDEALSVNSQVSCASCHKQEFAFADNRPFSKGFDDRLTSRNSPTILNVGSSTAFFWDMSVNSLTQQVVMPLTNHIEMGLPNHEALIKNINAQAYYEDLFDAAFGEAPNLDIDQVAEALAQFVVSINAFDSKFDDPFSFNDLELLGRDVFIESRCNNCHNVMQVNSFTSEAIFTGDPYTGGISFTSNRSAANIGLDKIPQDIGRENGSFKIPTLRNLSFSAPYMHDGRFSTLDQVIEHYDSEIKQSDFLDERLLGEDGKALRLGLSAIEKRALKAFLLTLDDHEVVQNPIYSDPFKRF